VAPLPVTAVSFGIQGSGQLVDGVPDPGRFREIARRAEELGYDSIWAGDHISYRNPILDVVVALSSAGGVEERITLGAGIVLLPLRHPSVVAKEFASLDYVSRGRVILGVGVGGESEKDYEAAGVDVHERGARANEAMAALRELFGGRPASFHGRFFSFDGIAIEPGPARPGGPPLWVGGRSPAALRRAGRLGDGWMPIWISPARYAEAWEEVRTQAEDAGRDPDAIVPAAVVPTLVDEDGERARAELRHYLELRYGTAFSPHAVERYCLAGTPSECAARAAAYAEAGVRHLIFNPSVPPDRLVEQVERLAEATAAVAV